jgi:hypothetical protein
MTKGGHAAMGLRKATIRHLKKRIVVQVSVLAHRLGRDKRGGAEFKTTGRLTYFEDFKPGTNPAKGGFEVASNIFRIGLIVAIFSLPLNSTAFCPVSFIPGEVSCGEQGEFKWIGLLAQGEGIGPNSQKGISISGGCPPYFWSASGGGYWLENDFTYGEDNIVYTDSEIDCLATITVLDKYGSQLTGYLRAPGEWKLKSEGVCELSGPPTSSNHNSYWHQDSIIIGDRMQVQRAGASWSSSGGYYTQKPNINCPLDCETRCGDGCDECITYDPWLNFDKSEFYEMYYGWPCFGYLKLINSGRYAGKWILGRKCTKVTMLKYYEWECN